MARNNTECSVDFDVEKSTIPELIFLTLDNIVSEKKYEYYKTKADLKLDISDTSYSCFSKINLASFKRVLSNLINNGIEATDCNGNVTVRLECDNETINISIADNGCGIPKEIIPNITKHGFSYCKKNGTGIGLSYAKEYIEKIGGLLVINSEIGFGTTVTIKLLRTEEPSWFCASLDINNNARVVILDDDPSIHDAWNEKLKGILGVEIVHFSVASDLTAETIITLNPDIYLIDYELLSDHKNGLDLIDELGLSQKSFLVTSCFEDSVVRSRCEMLGLKIIPKSYVPYIPIVTFNKRSDNTKLVFIDDDENMRMAWIFAAEEAGEEVHVYSHPDEFTKQMTNYDKNTVIYIDSDFGTDIPGEVYAKEFHEKGFTELHLATGYSGDKFKSAFWLKSIVGKEPPFFNDGKR